MRQGAERGGTDRGSLLSRHLGWQQAFVFCGSGNAGADQGWLSHEFSTSKWLAWAEETPAKVAMKCTPVVEAEEL